MKNCHTDDEFDALCHKININEIIQVEFAKNNNDDTETEIGYCDVNGKNKECLFQIQESSMEFVQAVHINDSNSKSNYVEWGRVLAESMYSTGKAYEICVKWFMATGQTVADVVLKNWSRGASKIGYHLFAVPEDMFAEPKNPFSSPLRCPIFVDIDFDLIPSKHFNLILRRALKVFGFIPINCSKHIKSKNGDLQYVHLCGGMFVKFVMKEKRFMWSWNHMFSQLYRTPVCTESFLDMMLKDFREFWKNNNQRLQVFIFETLIGLPYVDRTEITSALFPEVLLFDQTWNTIEDIKKANHNNALMRFFTDLNLSL